MAGLTFDIKTDPPLEVIAKNIKELDPRLINFRSSKLKKAAGYDPHKVGVSLLRKDVGRQFDKGGYYERGRFKAWDKTKKFGTRPAPRRTMESSGRLRGAWEGGSGGFSQVGKRSVTVGVNSARVKYADIQHQGGFIRARRTSKAGGKRMFWKLLFSFKVAMPGGPHMKGVNMPAKPIRGISPKGEKEITENYQTAYVRYAQSIMDNAK